MQVRVIFQNDNGYAISHSDVTLPSDRDDWQSAIVRHVNAEHPMGCGSAGRYRVEWPEVPETTESCRWCGWNQRYGAHAAACVTKLTHRSETIS